MIIFKDVLSECELFTDSYSPILDDKTNLYRICVKYVNVSGGIDESLIGGNASAEGEDACDAAADSSTRVVDAVHGCNLQEMDWFHGGGAPKTECSGFVKDYFKPYCKHLMKKLRDEGRSECEISDFQKSAKGLMDFIKGNWKDIAFFIGEDYGKEGKDEFEKFSFAVMKYGEDGSPEYMYFLKHSVFEEKA